MSKVLVTGGAGMIGSNLVKAMVRMGHDVRVVDNLWRGKLDYLIEESGKQVIDFRRDFYNLDLITPGVCDSLLGDTEYVVHLADIVAGIGYVFGHQGFLFRQNIIINSNVIDSVRRSKVKGFLYVGTACSFPATLQGNPDPVLLREEDLYPAQPESAYGWSKLMGQFESELLEKETGTPTAVLMLHNVYGSPADFTPETSQVIPSLIRKAIRYPEEPFVVWGTGMQKRAFLHVDDAVSAIVLALQKGFGQGVIQIGPSTATSINEIAEMIVDISGKDIDEISYDWSRPEGDKARCADFSKAKRVLSWQPKVDLKVGLTHLYSWIESRLNSGNPPKFRVAV